MKRWSTLVLVMIGGCARRPAPGQEVTVFAATSLREAFDEASAELGKSQPPIKVSLNFAGSQELRTQIEHGAPADVFASADMKHMDWLRTAKKVNDPVLFARNEPVVVVARESAEKIRTFADLPSARRIVIGAPDVPIGRYTLQVLDRAGGDLRARVEAHVVSRELNVRQVLAKVSLGEADAGIVYRTDAMAAADKIAMVRIPTEINVVAEYPIAVVAAAQHADAARAFIEYMSSPAGQAILARHGFLPP